MDGLSFSQIKNKAIRKIKTGTIVSGGTLVVISILIKIFSLFPFAVERYYSMGLYPYISIFYRVLFGWLPFSVGDLLYFFAGAYMLWLFTKFVIAAFKGRLRKINFRTRLKSALFFFAGIYIYFNLIWGLNYNRPGIATQLGLAPTTHTQRDLKDITAMLLVKVNSSRRFIENNHLALRQYKDVFDQAQQAYEAAATDFPFMMYKSLSVKRSMYGRVGNFLGFMGYYNPFTGESQLNLTIPRFLIPYVTCHEMAHQLGYASESEASFVGYLAAIHSRDSIFSYSTYYDLFSYANHELFLRDSAEAKNNYRLLDDLVKKDMLELKEYWRKSENVIEPLIKIFYDRYLKANQQRSGMKSYNEAVGWLIAYYKKYGSI